MPFRPARPWFNSPYVGVGFSLPVAWQGWAVLGGGIGALLLAAVVLHGSGREWVPVALLGATWALIRLTRAN